MEPFVPFDEFDQERKYPHKTSRKILDDHQIGFAGVNSVVAGSGVTVDATDPANPIVSAQYIDALTANSSGGNPLWVKAVEKQNGEPDLEDVLFSGEKSVFGAIQGLVGDSTNIKLTIAALPGANGKGGVISAYSVPGSFTPSIIKAYPDPVGSPVSATFTQMRVNDEENTEEDPELQSLDHMEFTVEIPVVFEDGLAQIVVTTDAGSYVLLEYAEQSIAHLTEVDIDTIYTDIHADRTGFTSGDTVTLSFTADRAVQQIFVWAHDIQDPSLTKLHSVYEVANLSSGTIEIVLEAEDLVEAFNATGSLYVSAGFNGQPTKIIETSSTFVFDERSPEFSTPAIDNVTYTYPGSQGAIKGSENVTVTVSNLVLAGKMTASFTGSRLSSVTAQPYVIVDGDVSFVLTRATAFNGPVGVSLVIYNTNNLKTANSPNNYVVVNVEDATFATPSVSVNSGFTIKSNPDGKAVTVSITSEVALGNPSGRVAFPGITFGGFATSDGGYEWHVTGTVTDSSARGTHVATISGTLLTAAGTEVVAVDDELLGSYKISGFDRRAVTITTPYASSLSLGSVVVDYAAGLVVEDISLNTLVDGVDWEWDNPVNDEINFLIPAFYNANVTGTLYVYVSQDSAP